MKRDLEKYLKQATKGVWGKKKLETVNELRGSIESRIWMLEQQGFSNTEALALALEELGKPSEINAGLVTVHSMPKMFKAMVVAAMLSSLAVIQTNLSVAQVTGAVQLPINQCSISTTIPGIIFFQGEGADTLCQGFWLTISSLRNVLEPLGIGYHRIASTPNTSKHVFTFPNNNELIIFPGAKAVNPNDIKPEQTTIEDSTSDFIPGRNFFDGLSKMTLPSSIEGWDNPKIQIGSTAFTLGTTEKTITGNSVYSQVFSTRIMDQYFPVMSLSDMLFTNTPGDSFESQSKFDHYLKVKNATPDTIYVMLYRTKSQGTIRDSAGLPLKFEYRSVDISPVFKTGYLIYRNPARKLEFITDPKNLKLVEYGETGQVVLMKFTGKLNANKKMLEVVPADQIEIVKHPGR